MVVSFFYVCLFAFSFVTWGTLACRNARIYGAGRQVGTYYEVVILCESFCVGPFVCNLCACPYVCAHGRMAGCKHVWVCAWMHG